MKVGPVIVSAPMVRAFLAGSKTQTRRMAWRENGSFVGDGPARPGYKVTWENVGSTPIPMQYAPTAWQKVKPGDLLYVRENFAYVGGGDPGILLYGATWEDNAEVAGCVRSPGWKMPKLTPCIHMPRNISRITLEVTAARIEKLQDISKEDVIAEGITQRDGQPIEDVVAGWHEPFAKLWDSLHGAGAWAANPEVVALTVKVHRQNVNSYLQRSAA